MPMKTPPKRKDDEAPPDVERHDEVYFRHPAGSKVGKVLSRGKHGCVVDSEGTRHKVPWGELHGHKTRVRPDVRVIDQGEDGMLVQDPAGRRRYVHDPLDPGAEPMGKSLLPMVLLIGAEKEVLAKALKDRPGLSLQDRTDRNGKQTKRWVRVNKPEPKARDKAAPEESGGPAPAAQKLPVGSDVKFKAGDFEGQGKIVGEPGEDGAHVEDSSGRKHTVHWHEMTHHAPPAAAGADAGEGAAKGEMFPDADKLPEKVSQPAKTWSKLEFMAKKGLAEYREALGAVAETLGLRTDVASPEGLKDDHVQSGDGFLFIAPLKSKARAQQKVDADYSGDWSQLRDVVRAAISVPSMEKLREAVEAVRASGLELAQQPKDRFARPTPEGYRDMMTVVKLPNGMLAELQYHLTPVTAAKETAHPFYETSRTLQAKYGEDEPTDQWSAEDHAAFYDARKQQQAIFSEAWDKAGAPKTT